MSWIRNFRQIVAVGSLGALLPWGSRPVLAEDWPAWRGAGAQGSVATGRYPERWSAETVAWKLELPGKGTSTPIVSKGRIYLTSPSDGEDAVMAVGLDGAKLWETKVGPLSGPKHRTLASSCNASPATDGHAIFARFRSGHLVALEPDGTLRWQVNLTEKFGAENLFWDSGSSPLAAGDLVIISRLHSGESWVAAFDAKTGDIRWKQARNFKVPSENDNGYATPVLIPQGDAPAVLVWGADHLTAHALRDGALLWTAGGFNPDGTGYWPAIATPVVCRDMAVVPVGRDDRPGQARLFGVRLGGSGDVSESHRAWGRTDLGVFVPAPAAAGDKVYLLRHRGEVVCVDPASGKTLWTGAFPKASAPYYASPVVANGILYAAREDGVVFAARVGERFEILSENPMGERLVASPVPATDRLLLRGDEHLFCVAASPTP
ncbi:MAG: PQQ-binding-like beta-propeller repeat protein [Verrucomicrobiae bacterium]|nr:PQQ-binding-like beta-propeller repeat protein [Verrucomicrobiae bacterium]